MGTRGLICVVKDAAFKVAQYGQFDHYPSGQGSDVLQFLRNCDLNRFSAQVDKCRFGTDAELKVITDKIELMSDVEFKSSEYAYLSRETASKILGIILGNRKPELILSDQHEFAGDSLFCEWAYVIDLDNGLLEVYQGFQNEPAPIGQRFADLNKSGEKYQPVQFVKAWNIKDLPERHEFINALSPKED